MARYILIMIAALALFIAGCTTSQNTIDSFDECVEAGNPVMESYPRQCSAGGETFVEEVDENNTDIKACTREYRPVCGEIQVQCVTTPCDPIRTTFSNRCEAENADATNITEGVCEDESSPEGACLSFDGNWLEEFNECEGMSENMCENLGGEYNECASACRNDPDAMVCTLQCVQVCKFN